MAVITRMRLGGWSGLSHQSAELRPGTRAAVVVLLPCLLAVCCISVVTHGVIEPVVMCTLRSLLITPTRPRLATISRRNAEHGVGGGPGGRHRPEERRLHVADPRPEGTVAGQLR